MDVATISLLLLVGILVLLAMGVPLGFATGFLGVLIAYGKFGLPGLGLVMQRMHGGVAVVTTLMAVIMAAMSGIIGGEIVLLGLVALPQMLRLGYNQNLAIGTVCVGGSLGTMIPPSIVLIVYGLITETSIHALFIAAVVPGLMMGGIYIAYVIVRTQLNPSLAPID